MTSDQQLTIVHATSVHRWDDGRIFERQCRSLAARGHRVVLLAPGADGSRAVDGVEVVGLGTPRGRSSRMLASVNTVRRAVRSIAPDVAVFHDPELLRLFVTRNRPFAGTATVYDAHEDYRAQIRDKEWLPRPVRRAAGASLGTIELFASERVDHVICATPDIAVRFRDRRAHVVLNRPLLRDLPPVESIDQVSEHVRRVCYVGDLRAVRGAHALVDAMELVNRRRPVRLVIAGRITPSTLADELAARPGWAHVDALGWRSRDEVYELMATADAATLPFLAAENHVASQPNKLFEYMLMGLPIVASDFERWRSLAEEAGADFHPTVPGSADSIAGAILEVVSGDRSSEQRRSAARRARGRFSWESIEDDYVRFIESLPGSAGRR